ncbi:MAG: ComEC/Rec2 family competence protein [Clostridia bacterium]|nr:ComEC/Rec2 family competence protein [Clostridia bacterium]
MRTGTFWEERPLVPVAVFGGLGVLVGLFLPEVPALLLLWGCLVGMLLGALSRPLRIKAVYGAMLAVFCLLGLRAQLASNAQLPPEGVYRATGAVAELPGWDEETGHATVRLRDVTLTAEDGSAYAVSGAYWSYYGEEGAALPQPGTLVGLEARLYHPSGQRNPYGFDFRQYLRQNGMTIGLYNQGAFEQGGEARGLSYWMLRLRGRLIGRLDALYGENGALPKALLFGSRQELSVRTRQAFARSGVAHVLAISGLHITLLTSALYLLLRKFLPLRPRFWATAAFLLLYCLLLGFRASVVRAAVLTLCAGADRLRGRRSDPLSALSLAFLTVLLINPYELTAVGFQLSFLAVFGMVLLAPGFGRLFRRLGRRVSAALASTFSAGVGTLIPATQAFHYLSLSGLLFSPLVCALMYVLLPGYALSLLLSFLSWPVGRLIATALGFLSAALERAAFWVSELPYASVNVPSIPWPLIPCFAVLVFCLSPYAALGRRRRVALCLALLALGSAVHLATLDRGLSYTQLDVGSEDCAILQDGRRTVAVDCGTDGEDLTAYLLATGRSLDAVVLTHLHTDHCLGLNTVLDAGIRVGQVILPVGAEDQRVSAAALALMERVRSSGIPVRTVGAGDDIVVGRIRMEALWPIDGMVRPGQDANRYSLTARCELGGLSLLLTGDLLGEYERYAAAPADILKVAHHGSAAGTGDGFLDVVSPRTALISVSRTSPAAEKEGETQKRLRERGVPIYTTASCGAIRLEPTADGWTVKPFIGMKEEP